jgi:membrane peptidoglycan carboxypeptidase
VYVQKFTNLDLKRHQVKVYFKDWPLQFKDWRYQFQNLEYQFKNIRNQFKVQFKNLDCKVEIHFTILIEITWSKKRIIEIYLNEIEMGNGIYGAEAAAKKYFRKPAKDLSKRESALIAAVLPNPIRWTPANPNAYIQRRQYRILRAMRYVGKPEYLK